MRASRIIGIAALGLSLWGAVPAFGDIYDDYRRSGSINPCNYSDGQLRNGLKNLPPDIQQYAPGLGDQLAAGREGCGGGGDTRITTAVPLPGAPTGGGGPTAIPKPPAPKASKAVALAGASKVKPVALQKAGSDVPGWLTPILIAAFLIGGGGLALYFTGRSPDRLRRRLGASVGDAEGRASDAFAQLRDVFRFGR
jgi:hypothetical protein